MKLILVTCLTLTLCETLRASTKYIASSRDVVAYQGLFTRKTIMMDAIKVEIDKEGGRVAFSFCTINVGDTINKTGHPEEIECHPLANDRKGTYSIEEIFQEIQEQEIQEFRFPTKVALVIGTFVPITIGFFVTKGRIWKIGSSLKRDFRSYDSVGVTSSVGLGVFSGIVGFAVAPKFCCFENGAAFSALKDEGLALEGSGSIVFISENIDSVANGLSRVLVRL